MPAKLDVADDLVLIQIDYRWFAVVSNRRQVIAARMTTTLVVLVAAINHANVTRHRPKHLDRESMILWLQHRQAAGQSLVWTKVCLENRDYALAIRREFESWREALQAAGVRAAK